jgi:hypothetical protein
MQLKSVEKAPAEGRGDGRGEDDFRRKDAGKHSSGAIRRSGRSPVFFDPSLFGIERRSVFRCWRIGETERFSAKYWRDRLTGQARGTPQALLIAFVQRNKAKRLFRPGNGPQHFRRALYRTRLEEKHEPDLAAFIQQLWQRHQTASEGIKKKSAGAAITIRFSEHDGSEFCRPDARWTWNAL